MDYLQQLFSFFNAPLFATFILGAFWKRMTAAAGWTGLVAGTLSAVTVFVLSETGVIHLPGQGSAFLAAGAAFIVSVVVSLRTAPKPAAQLTGLVYGLTPKEDLQDPRDRDEAWYQRPGLMSVSGPRTRRTGAFGIRAVIAALFAVFGPILLGVGLFGTSDADLKKADGVNVNLWTGAGLLAAAVVFLVWTWLRPIVVETEDDRD